MPISQNGQTHSAHSANCLQIVLSVSGHFVGLVPNGLSKIKRKLLWLSHLPHQWEPILVFHIYFVKLPFNNSLNKLSTLVKIH